MKSIKIILAAAAAMLLSVSVYAQDFNSVLDKYNKAAELISAKDFPQAITVLNEVVAEGLQVGDEAKEVVTNAQKLLPTCHYQLGGRLAQAKNWQQASEHFAKAVELGELYGADRKILTGSKTWLGRSYVAMGAEAFNNKDFAKAAEIFQQGLEKDPSNADLKVNLASAYGEMGDIDQALTLFNEVAVLTGPKYEKEVAEAKEKIGYYQTIDIQRAIEAKDYATANSLIDQILATDPDNAVVNMLLVQTATNQQNWRKVISAGEKAASVQTDPEMQSSVYFLLGAAYQNSDNIPKAIESYRKVTAGGRVAAAKAQITALSK